MIQGNNEKSKAKKKPLRISGATLVREARLELARP